MPDPLRLRELLTPGDPALARAYQILQETFPTSELIRAAEFLRAMTERAAGAWNDLLWHVVVGERGSLLNGVVTGTYLAALNVGFVSYLAVDPKQRSRGIGHRLRRSLIELFDGDAWHFHGRPAEAVVGEVEPHNPWLQRLIREQGAIALDVPYRQPSIRPGEPTVPLVLYYQPLQGRRTSLPVQEVRQILFGIWHHAYRIVTPFSDPEFREMMRALAGRDVVGGIQRPLEFAGASPD
ncbi:MAG TPA: GNAT family N-acetyltransferase [Gemmatimonadales bacterium]|jgi:GNAT superfamily N-acetyltransferase|nr:GNAT family N-acetyltransferase [Gemmatimonadales bacterium]